MPLPIPTAEQSEQEFISRCLSDDTMQSEFPDEEQRMAVCISQWDNSKEEKAVLTDKQRIPPKAAQESAKKVLKWKEEHGDEVRGMTHVGWTRARQLASGKPLSENVIKRMAQFNRHRENAKINPKYKNEPWKDRGYVAWEGWGGTVGIDWAIRMSKKIREGKQRIDNNEKQCLKEEKPQNNMQELENKSLNLDFKFEEATGTIKGYASVFDNLDRTGDIVKRGAFQKALECGKKIKMLWQHNQDNPIGMFNLVREDDKGLYVEGKLTKGVKQAEEARALLMDGAIDGLSIGYRTEDFEMEDGVRLLKELDVREISLVTFPANEEATVTDVKTETTKQDDTKEEEKSKINIDEIKSLKDIEKTFKDVGLTQKQSKHIIKTIKDFVVSDYQQKQAGEMLALELEKIITEAKQFIIEQN